MGRPYEAELLLLAATYEWALHADIETLTQTISTLRGLPLVVVGSGGSLSGCVFAARLHETHARLPGHALTPLEFIRHPAPQAAGVLLLSAGGSNPDVLAAAEHAIASEYSSTVGLCTRTDTPLKARLAKYRHTTVLEFEGPSKKDGFLATNSLLLISTLLARAYGVELPRRLPALDAPLTELALGETLDRSHVLVLADGWASAAAVDLESKWAESGFGSVVVTDARNFAHGRHQGLSRRLSDTLVLGLAVAGDDASTQRAESDDVLASTITRLPRSGAVSTLRSPLSAEAGALDLLVRVIYLTGEAGHRRGFDPGRPRVPAFGRALYRARVPRSVLQHAQADSVRVPEDLWIRRKVTHAVWAGTTEETREGWRALCRAWASEVGRADVGGVVLDYDGTVCETHERFGIPAQDVGDALTRLLESGMLVGFATGRGDSVVQALRAVTPELVWPQIIVGMYNGGVLIRLHEEPTAQPEKAEAVERAYTILSTSPIVTRVAQLHLQPRQLSVRVTRALPEGLLRRFVLEALHAAMSSLDVEVVSSGHSVDVLPRAVSKQCVVAEVRRELWSMGRPDLAVMTIGDQGQAGGNDASFLAHPLGLSVERASSDFTGCWNVAPRGAQRTVALLGYLKAFRRRADGGFCWSVRQACRSLRWDTRQSRTTTPSGAAEGSR